MTSIFLTWYQRISLWNRIGTIPVTSLKDASVYLRIIEKVRPTDEEQKETKLTTLEGGYRWTLPEANYGNVTLELEQEEAEALVKGLETHPQPVLVADAAWMLELLAKLTPAAEPAEPKKKRLAAV